MASIMPSYTILKRYMEALNAAKLWNPGKQNYWNSCSPIGNAYGAMVSLRMFTFVTISTAFSDLESQTPKYSTKKLLFIILHKNWRG